jgi:hypothetical protein
MQRRVEAVVDGLGDGGHLAVLATLGRSSSFIAPIRLLLNPMSKRFALPAPARFTARTAGRNMTKSAYAAAAAGVAAMVVRTIAPACEMAHHCVAGIGRGIFPEARRAAGQWRE